MTPKSLSRRQWMLANLAASAGGLGWVRQTAACEVQAEFLRVIHPWTRATAPDATEAVLCMGIDDVIADDRLIGVRTPVASGFAAVDLPATTDARGATQVLIARGSVITMHDQGPHLRLLGLRIVLEAGRSYPLNLHFERSGVVMSTLSVDYTRFS